MATREVVTLQLGHYANFVGTHLWNIQESSFIYNVQDCKENDVNHDVLYREGYNLNREQTYTPRLVIADLKGRLNTLKQEGVLYDIADADGDLNWNCDVTMHKLDKVDKNEFLKDLDGDENIPEEEEEDRKRRSSEVIQESVDEGHEGTSSEKVYNLDDKVTVWSDFLRLHLHPKTTHVVQQYKHNDELNSFALYGQGETLYKDYETRNELDDRLHFFLEECDYLQGINMLVDTHDGFSGLGAAMLEDFSDEYSGKSSSVFAISPPVFEEPIGTQTLERIVNNVLNFNSFCEHSSMMMPLSVASSLWRKPGPPRTFSYLDYKYDLPYHSSAILGATIDSITLPYRLKSGGCLMSHMVGSLTPLKRKALCTQTSFPFPVYENNYLVQSLLGFGDDLPWQCLTPKCSSQGPTTAQCVILRGISENKLKGPPSPDLPRSLDRCTSREDVLQLYLRDTCNTSMNAIFCASRATKVTAPFPNIFNKYISKTGFVSDTERPSHSPVEEVPALCSLQSTTQIRVLIDDLIKEGNKVDIHKCHRSLDAGLEVDDYKEALNSLEILSHCYDDTDNDLL